MLSPVLATVLKEPVTSNAVKDVIARLRVAACVEDGQGSGFMVSSESQKSPQLHINVVGDTLSVSVRKLHGDFGMWVAASVASMLGVEMVASDGTAMPATAATVRKLWEGSCSEEGLALAEKLGLVLPRIKGTSRSINF